MHTTLVAVVLVCISAASQPPATAAQEAAARSQPPGVRAKLETAIPEAIRLLEANEHLKFLKTFVAPDDLQQMLSRAQAPLEDAAKGFAARGAGRLLTVLKAIQRTTPQLSANGNTAVFMLEEPIDGLGRISIVKIDGLWYVKN